MLSDINMKSGLRRVVFLFHFHRLSVCCLLLFGRQRFLIARALVHKCAVLSAELLSHPFGTCHAARGGEEPRTGCAPRWLVATEQFVHMFEAHLRSTIQHTSAIYCAATIGHELLFCTQCVPGASALIIAKATG